MNALLFTLGMGMGATAVSDLWGLARGPLLGVPFPDYGLVGRWVGHMRHGRFHHAAIARSAPVRGERVLGWSVHYLTGIAFAAVITVVGGSPWMQQPTPKLALAVGVGTVAAPFLLMQPGMGAGIAASRTAKPAAARLQSLLLHTWFGLGLYLSGWALSRLTMI